MGMGTGTERGNGGLGTGEKGREKLISSSDAALVGIAYKRTSSLLYAGKVF